VPRKGGNPNPNRNSFVSSLANVINQDEGKKTGAAKEYRTSFKQKNISQSQASYNLTQQEPAKPAAATT